MNIGLVIADLDDTLIGDGAGEEAIIPWLEARDFPFCIATGRDLDEARAQLVATGLPEPDHWITDVGTRITRGARGAEGTAEDSPCDDDASWESALGAFDGDRVRALLGRAFGWPLQGLQTRLKASFAVASSQSVERVESVLGAAGIRAEIIHSHGRYLDVLPHAGSKGHAVRHLAGRLGVRLDQVVAAGDSGNDLSMLSMVGCPVIVANHHPELASLARSGRAFVSAYPRGLGVIDGVAHYRQLPERGETSGCG